MRRLTEAGRRRAQAVDGVVPSGALPQSRSPTTPPSDVLACPRGLQVTRNGNRVSIRGNVDFRRGDLGDNNLPVELPGTVPPEWQAIYLRGMNRIWTGKIGNYDVDTQLSIGPGGIIHYSGNPRNRTEMAEIGGNRIYQLPIEMGKEGVAERFAGHGFGHILGNPDGSGIMGHNVADPPLPKHVEEVLKRCRL